MLLPTVVIVSLLLPSVPYTGGVRTERKLYDQLLAPQRYNKLIRPGTLSKAPTIVHLGLRLSQFINVDEQKEVIQTQVWLEQEWQDVHLQWNPACFGGVESIHVPAEELWRPDIVLYNNADGKYEITTLTRAEVFFNGTVRWMPPALYLSACRIDMEYFPYDEQICSMRFGSWTYDGSKVDLRHHLQKYAPELSRPLHIDYAADLHNFGSTIEYDVISVSAVCYDRAYQHSPHPYPEVVFQFRMRRRTVFHTFNLLLPCVAIAVLAVMTFLLPPECREKISLSITTLLALTLFFLLISKTAPPTSLAVPLIGKYLLFTIVLITSSILLTVVVLNIHFRSAETHSMGKWMRCIFLEVLPPLLGLQPPKHTKKAMKQVMHEVVNNRWAIQKMRSPKHSKCRLRDHRDVNHEATPDSLVYHISRQFGRCCSDKAQIRLQRKLHYVAEGSKFIERRLRVIRREKDMKEEWQFVALVMDRLSLCLFSVVSIICTFCITLQSPALWDRAQPLTPSTLPMLANLTAFNDAGMRSPNRTIHVILPRH
ncbi:Acetylcholine receptor subunit alpha-like 2 [Taenia crassiceps]|uniref:Acetylcholine receptor subunit alpha-like 2 n=1 Tax=Taenia crassiceps TaxID=6207 RepID=A0ABR4QME4_9CEST